MMTYTAIVSTAHPRPGQLSRRVINGLTREKLEIVRKNANDLLYEIEVVEEPHGSNEAAQ